MDAFSYRIASKRIETCVAPVQPDDSRVILAIRLTTSTGLVCHLWRVDCRCRVPPVRALLVGFAVRANTRSFCFVHSFCRFFAAFHGRGCTFAPFIGSFSFCADRLNEFVGRRFVKSLYVMIQEGSQRHFICFWFSATAKCHNLFPAGWRWFSTVFT